MTKDASGEKLRTTIRSFFVNNSLRKNKELMWKLYTSWIYQDEIGDPTEHYDVLFFYERLTEFMDELYDMAKSNDKD